MSKPVRIIILLQQTSSESNAEPATEGESIPISGLAETPIVSP
jgi:hypothetical protein